jgi:hypothetical protein
MPACGGMTKCKDKQMTRPGHRSRDFTRDRRKFWLKGERAGAKAPRLVAA